MKRWSSLVFLMAMSAACSPDFERPSEVLDFRILAVQVEPPEYIYKVSLDESGMPEIDMAALSIPAARVTVLVSNPLAPDSPFEYVVEGCNLDTNLACVEDDARLEYGSGTAVPEVFEVPVVLGLEQITAAFTGAPFFGVYGAASWIAGQLTYQEEEIAFLKAFVLSPDYGQGRVPNTNPRIAGILTGEKGQEVPLPLDADAVFQADSSEEYRLSASFPEGTRETYVVKAVDLSVVAAQDEVDFAAIWKNAYDKELTEELNVDFYGTCGVFSDDRKSESLNVAFESEKDKDNKDLSVTWTAPDEPVPCTLWFVAGDSRGGVGWYRLSVNIK